MIKKTFLVAFAFITGLCAAQDKEFYDIDEKISNEENSHYYIVVNEADGPDTLKSFYTKTNTPRSFIAVQDNRMEGAGLFYHENGQLKAKAFYKEGMLAGKVETWYPSGKPQSVEYFDPKSEVPTKMMEYWDSVGVQLIRDGGGACNCFFGILSGTETREQGQLKDGVRHSLWKGFRKDNKLYFEETYDNGEFVSGVSYDTLGNQYSYAEHETMAVPMDGLNSLYNHIGSNLKYPKPARRNGTEGKVFVEFLIDKEGNVTNVKTIKGIGSGCDEEAVNAIKSLPKWKPGKQRGQLVRQKMVLPIMFKLGE